MDIDAYLEALKAKLAPIAHVGQAIGHAVSDVTDKVAELIANGDSESAVALLNALKNDAQNVADAIKANTAAEHEPTPPVGETPLEPPAAQPPPAASGAAPVAG